MKHHMSVLGIDIAKRSFPVVGMDERGQIVLRKRLSRHDLRPCIATLPPVLIGMEACGGAHDWARRFREHGHEVTRMAPQFGKASVKSNTNDMRDAEGMGEAVTRPPHAFCADEGRRPARYPSAPSGARAPERGPHGSGQ